MLRKKSPVTRPGIDAGTFRLVARCLNHYATQGPAVQLASHIQFTYTANRTQTKPLASSVILAVPGRRRLGQAIKQTNFNVYLCYERFVRKVKSKKMIKKQCRLSSLHSLQSVSNMAYFSIRHKARMCALSWTA